MADDDLYLPPGPGYNLAPTSPGFADGPPTGFQGYDPTDPNSVPQNYSGPGFADGPEINPHQDMLQKFIEDFMNKNKPQMDDGQIKEDRYQLPSVHQFRMQENPEQTGDVNALDPTMFAGRRMNLMDVDPAEIMALKTIHGPKFR